MRARIVAEPGLWPAFRTLGTTGGNWPRNGEIDIMEYYNDAVHANFCVGTEEDRGQKWDSASKLVSDFDVEDWDANFHIWRMDWNEDEITLYLDGEEMNHADQSDLRNADGSYPLRRPQYLLVNPAIGGKGRPDPSNTYFPNHYVVDYVSVFFRE